MLPATLAPNPLVSILTSTAPPVRWLLPDFLPEASLVILAGEAGVGKSFLAYSLGLALASQTPILNRTPTSCSTVLYFDQENGQYDRDQYLRWAWHGLGQPPLPLLADHFWPEHFTLGGATWASQAAAVIEAKQPNLIIIDTATPACNVQDENDNAEASRVVSQLRRLMLLAPGCSMLVLKHAKPLPDNAGYTVRGAKTWIGAVDAVMFQLRGRGRPRKHQLRDTRLEPAKTRAFGLRQTILLHPEWTTGEHGILLKAETQLSPD